MNERGLATGRCIPGESVRGSNRATCICNNPRSLFEATHFRGFQQGAAQLGTGDSSSGADGGGVGDRRPGIHTPAYTPPSMPLPRCESRA